MKEYHKIITLFERDSERNFKKVIDGVYATPEFKFLSPLEWICTEKVDGTNIRIIWDGSVVIIKGRTDRATIPAALETRLRELFYPGLMSVVFGTTPVCIYGEGFGKKIHTGERYISDGVDFIMFDVLINNFWLARSDIFDISNKCSCSIVPIIYRGDLDGAVEFIKSRPNSKWGTFTIEGIVMYPTVELRNRAGNRVISKLKISDF